MLDALRLDDICHELGNLHCRQTAKPAPSKRRLGFELESVLKLPDELVRRVIAPSKRTEALKISVIINLYTRHYAQRVRAGFHVGEWLSLVEHLVRDQGVGGSNPLSPTIFQSDTNDFTSPVQTGAADLWQSRTEFCDYFVGFRTCASSL
jgi:hypothetical protein